MKKILLFLFFTSAAVSFAQKTRTTYFTLGDCANGDTTFAENFKVAKAFVATDNAKDLVIKDIELTVYVNGQVKVMAIKWNKFGESVTKTLSSLKPGNKIVAEITVTNKSSKNEFTKETKLPTHIYHVK
jgi:hypothetical protein